MSEFENMEALELSMDELDQAAGGGADCWDFEGFQG